MTIGVLGLGHFASVVAHCLRLKGFDAFQFDDAPYLVRAEQREEPEIKEVTIRPGWHLTNCEVIWAAYDVPLDAHGRGLDDLVIGRIGAMLTSYVREGTLVLLSPQWRVGGTRRLEAYCDREFTFAYVMENVRVGTAVRDFLNPLAIVVGLRNEKDFDRLDVLHAFAPLCVMGIESAEMTKHALNCQLALQIAWSNEIARLCAVVGADPHKVVDGLRIDKRISPHAPIRPGAPFGGGSLKRDVLTLRSLGGVTDTPIIDAIIPSNEWSRV